MWDLLHPGCEHLSPFGQSLAGCLPLVQEKHILLSATTFARWVGVFSLNTAHFHSGCFPLHTIQGSKLVVVELPDGADFEPCEAPCEEVLDLIVSSTRLWKSGTLHHFVGLSLVLEPSSEMDQRRLVHFLFNRIKRPGFPHIGRQLANCLV